MGKIIRALVSYGAKAWALTKREEQAVLIFVKKIFRRICVPKYENVEWKSRTNRELEEMNESKMYEMAKDNLVRAPTENGGFQDAQKDFHSRTGSDEKQGKNQEKMGRGSRKRSSIVGSEKMERVGGRYQKMERHCSTGQSPQWAVVPMEKDEEEEEEVNGQASTLIRRWMNSMLEPDIRICRLNVPPSIFLCLLIIHLSR